MATFWNNLKINGGGETQPTIDTYTKTEINGLLETKVNKVDYDAKVNEIDTNINKKANTTDLINVNVYDVLYKQGDVKITSIDKQNKNLYMEVSVYRKTSSNQWKIKDNGLDYYFIESGNNVDIFVKCITQGSGNWSDNIKVFVSYKTI